MTQFKIKRVYEAPEKTDGYRVFVDRLWPRGMKKEFLKYDEWNKELAPSPGLRTWFHRDRNGYWEEFARMYSEELSKSEAVSAFVERIRSIPTVTLLYASKEPLHNHARILQGYLEKQEKN